MVTYLTSNFDGPRNTFPVDLFTWKGAKTHLGAPPGQQRELPTKLKMNNENGNRVVMVPQGDYRQVTHWELSGTGMPFCIFHGLIFALSHSPHLAVRYFLPILLVQQIISQGLSVWNFFP